MESISAFISHTTTTPQHLPPLNSPPFYSIAPKNKSVRLQMLCNRCQTSITSSRSLVRSTILPMHHPSRQQPGKRSATLSPLVMHAHANREPSETDDGSTKNKNLINPHGPSVHAPFSLSNQQLWLRRSVKNFLYSQVSLAHSIGTLNGKRDPYIDFQVDDEPPSLFVNYKLRPDKMDAFKASINLPEEVELMPIACTDESSPEYQITLNAYQVSGITNGLRAEWSTYIDRGDGKPSFLVLDAQTDNFSMDPVDIITTPTTFTYTDNTLTEEGDHELKLNITPDKQHFFSFQYTGETTHAPGVLPNRLWIAANDYIFWANGICDRAFYDGAVMNTPLSILDPSKCKIIYNMEFSKYTEPEASEVFLLGAPARFVISPMFNINEEHRIKEGHIFGKEAPE